MRCARFGVGDQWRAEDFVALLKTNRRARCGRVSPRGRDFRGSAKSTITMLKLTIAPPTAEATIDGIAVKGNATVPVFRRRTHAAG